MRFFDQYRTYVASTNLRLIEDTPNVIQQAVHNAILTGSDIVTDITNTTVNAFGRRGDRFYEYGRDSYYLGLPEGDLGKEVPKYDEVKKILNQLYPQPEGYELTYTEVLVDPLNTGFLGEMFIWNGGLPPYVGQITEPKWELGTGDETGESFLTFKTAWSPGPGDRGYRRYVTANIIGKNTARFLYRWYKQLQGDDRYAWVDDTKDFTTTEDLIISPDELYYHVVYTQRRLSDGAITWATPKSWLYQINSNKYPQLNLEYSTRVNQYLPIVPLRVNNKDLMEPNDSDQYKTTKKILSIVELDIKEIREGLNNNPDIASIDHAYFTFGIGMKNTEKWALDYMYWFFFDMYARQSTTKVQVDAWRKQVDKKTPPPYNTLTVQDGTYHMLYYWYYVHRSEEVGSFGKVGDVRMTTSNDKGEFDKMYYRPNSSSDAREWEQRSTQDEIYIDKQIANNRFVRLTVCGFSQYNMIYNTKLNVVTTIASAEEVFLPVNYSYVTQLPFLDRNSFYYAAMRLQINAYETIKLKWYETNFFRFVVQVIAIAITVLSNGFSLFIQGLSTAISAGLVAISIFVAKFILSSIVIKVGFEYLAEELGVEWAAVIAVVAATFGALGNKGMLNLPFANEMAFIGTNLFKGAQEYLASLGEDIQNQMEVLTYEYADKMEELEAINKELETNVNTLMDPVGLYTEVGMLPLETPSEYFQRSLLVNPGIQSIDAISSFVDNSLRLPKL